jgi:predicted dehydrogenase
MTRARSSEPLRVALVGGGAVVQTMYAPALLRQRGYAIACVVDADPARAAEIEAAFKVRTLSGGWEALVADERLCAEVDAAVICLPHALHAPAAIALMERGKHILCEKPIAASARDARAMQRVAEDRGVVLSVALLRRFYRKNIVIRELLAAGRLGPLASFELVEGFDYRWPTKSAFFFDRALAGGGVLMDTGSHALDLVRWWFGAPEEWEYYDDAQGGVEANCELRLRYRDDVHGRIVLSRTDVLGERYTIRARHGTLSTAPDAESPVQLDLDSFSVVGAIGTPSVPALAQSLAAVLEDLFEDFRDAVVSGRPPRVAAADAVDVVAWMEECYARARPLVREWDAVDVTIA